MRILNQTRLRPFSHLPGTIFPIPYTTWEAKIFPAKIFFRNLAGGEKEEIDLPIRGPIKGFTTTLDLDRGKIDVRGWGAKGYFSLPLQDFLPVDIQRKTIRGDRRRLSLGVHKKQDWDAICQRKNPAEIFPLWVRMAQILPFLPLPKKKVGTMHLLDADRLLDLFQAGFVGLLSPRFSDEHFLGLVEKVVFPPKESALGLVHEGARLIESLFFQDKKDLYHFLPNLPKELHAGKFTGIETLREDGIDFEWSKKTLKRAIIRPKRKGVITLKLQSKIRSFRMRYNLRLKGKQVPKHTPLSLERGAVLYLDRFLH